jgi:hypothetical protein
MQPHLEVITPSPSHANDLVVERRNLPLRYPQVKANTAQGVPFSGFSTIVTLAVDTLNIFPGFLRPLGRV